MTYFIFSCCSSMWAAVLLAATTRKTGIGLSITGSRGRSTRTRRRPSPPPRAFPSSKPQRRRPHERGAHPPKKWTWEPPPTTRETIAQTPPPRRYKERRDAENGSALSPNCLNFTLLPQSQPAAPQPPSSGLADLLMVDTMPSQPAATGTSSAPGRRSQ